MNAHLPARLKLSDSRAIFFWQYLHPAIPQIFLRALELAHSTGIVTIGLTGARGGHMVELCDFCLRMPSDLTMKIQEAHLALEHIFCLLVEEIYFAN